MADRNTDTTLAIPALLDATLFAAEKHRSCRRKDAEETPYIIHPIKVVHLLAHVGGVTDIAVLQAGMLHDTVEDTDATEAELAQRFGTTVSGLVMEVTDDKALDKAERKRRQVEHAPQMSPGAKLIKIADKIANVTDLVESPPAGWSKERRIAYLEWSKEVVAGCRGLNEYLEQEYDRRIDQATVLLTS